MRRIAKVLWAALAAFAGAGALAGCAASGATVLGQAPSSGENPREAVRTVVAARSLATGRRVVLHATAIEKCPISGCWFIVRDAPGPIKVDTKAAGFTVAEMPLQTSIVVAGRVARNGSETLLEATGVRY